MTSISTYSGWEAPLISIAMSAYLFWGMYELLFWREKCDDPSFKSLCQMFGALFFPMFSWIIRKVIL